MHNNIIDYLTESAKRVPNKIAYSNGEEGLTFGQLHEQSRSVAAFLHENAVYRQPVVVFMNKHPNVIAAFMGVVTARDYYVPIDAEMPEVRINLILDNVQSKVMICDRDTVEAASKLTFNGKIVCYDEICHTPVQEEALEKIYHQAIDIDPIYIVFTSGSTGIPKGVAACHRSVLDYIDHLVEITGFNEDSIFGNQTPLYVDACLKEIYSTLKMGATTFMIQKSLFMQPIKLMEFLNEHKINSICWVSSALTIVSSLGTFKTIKPEYLHTICFQSEVFTTKQFNRWREILPNAKFINLYGPTEGTGVCCYYVVDREIQPDEVIPMGKAIENREVFLLDENDKLADEGEICISGTAVTLGYYNDMERTANVFVQNPLNKIYPEIIYRTGDLARYNKYGELEYISRKDYQIKHMGHRIELGEIEINVNMLEHVEICACIYDDNRKKIVLYYVGDMEEKELALLLQDKLPRYMIPNAIKHLDEMLYTTNGKIDRKTLKNNYQNK